uniref:Uncharacterized protein n=1 Tax=Chromera velia CCMP2878 TaxID=1169474 RepID=A0A0G4IBA1_9ALVE|eukprot:Cvel_12778.t1-p1 / transcript=Cvel_12778.t1 / gene=Cvel_12778 / organism=Chromera_velia_CCMP2878 / gene_product=Zinc finger protein 345, putative / transcript_product=Zinc finger protein 345, putative / location=Cvel_scaffold850:32849-33499(+) / protein_length=217 / sequence_SO=supercontig / SO=protein_coding / is_pseudo=false
MKKDRVPQRLSVQQLVEACLIIPRLPRANPAALTEGRGTIVKSAKGEEFVSMAAFAGHAKSAEDPKSAFMDGDERTAQNVGGALVAFMDERDTFAQIVEEKEFVSTVASAATVVIVKGVRFVSMGALARDAKNVKVSGSASTVDSARIVKNARAAKSVNTAVSALRAKSAVVGVFASIRGAEVSVENVRKTTPPLPLECSGKEKLRRFDTKQTPFTD